MIRKNAFIANQNKFHQQKLYKLHSKPFFTHKNFFCTCLSSLSAKISIFTNQKFSIYRKLKNRPQKLPFYIQKPFICTSLSLLVSKPPHFHKPKAFLLHKPFLLPPKAALFHPPPPISTTLNLLFAKNTAVLLLFALNPCAVKPEPRTDSNHCRRYSAKLQFFAKPVT